MNKNWCEICKHHQETASHNSRLIKTSVRPKRLSFLNVSILCLKASWLFIDIHQPEVGLNSKTMSSYSCMFIFLCVKNETNPTYVGGLKSSQLSLCETRGTLLCCCRCLCTHELRRKKLYTSVEVTPAPVRVPTLWSLVPRFTSVVG